MGTASVCVRSAFIDVHTSRSLWLETILTEALTINAFSIVGTIKIRRTQRTHVHLFAQNFCVRLCTISLLASTHIARIGIFTDSMWGAWILDGQTFVNVMASVHWVTVAAFGTKALKAAGRICAVSIASAWRTSTFVIVGTTVRRTSVSVETGRTVTAITALKVCTYGTRSASIRQRTFVNIGTL